MATGDSSTDKILIIGAGCCGLTIAQGLKKHGIPYALYERAESKHTKRNWTFSLHWGFHALKHNVPQEMLDQLQSVQADPNISINDSIDVTSFNGQTGEVLKPAASHPVYRLRRDLFRNLLLQGLDVNWNKKLADISYSADGRTVSAHFTDGTTDTGISLIGCDGAHSVVRTHLVGPANASLDPTGYGCAILYASHTAEHARFLRSPPFNPIYNLAPHPEKHLAWLTIQSAEDPSKPEEWVFASYISSPEPAGFTNALSEPELLAEHKRLGAKFADPFRSAYAWATPERSTIEYVKLQNWDPRKENHRWESPGGRTSLAGDAAHAMTFQRGQGLNSALQDARVYVEACVRWWGEGEVQRAAAVADYEKEMVARGGEEVQLSKEMTDHFHNNFDTIVRQKGWPNPMIQKGRQEEW